MFAVCALRFLYVILYVLLSEVDDSLLDTLERKTGLLEREVVAGEVSLHDLEVRT